MKLLLKKRMNVKSQNPMTFKNALSGKYKRLAQIKTRCCSLSTFLTQNTGKGSPGHSRSPGTGRCLIPIGNLVGWEGGKSLYFNELQQLNTIHKSIIINT